MRKRRVPPVLTFISSLFVMLSFGLLSLRNPGEIDFRALALGVFLPFALWLQAFLVRRFFKGSDALVLIIVNFLCGVGLVLLYRLNPDVALKQAVFYAVGAVAMMITSATVRALRQTTWEKVRIPLMVVSIMLLLLPVLFGKWTYGAKNWIDLKFFSFQPSELVKVFLIVIMASYLSQRRRIVSLVPAGIYLGACLGVLMLQRDLGAALLYFFTALLMYYAATSNLALCGAGLGIGAIGAVYAYAKFDHVRTRVAIWQNPWATPSGQGYQIVQSLMAIGSGGLLGLGLGLGLPRSVPAYHTDFIFAVLCEEFGILFGLCVLGLYMLLGKRGMAIARHARTRFDALLALGVTSLLLVQTLVIIGGVIKMIPLTGVTMPFVSYGGSSLVSCMILAGVLQGVAAVNHAQDEEDLLRLEEQEEAWR